MDEQTTYASPAKCPFQPDGGADWKYRDPVMVISARMYQTNPQRMIDGIGPVEPLVWFEEQLGPPTRVVDHEGQSWSSWEDPDYIIYVHPNGQIALDTPEGVSSKRSAGSVLWDCGVLDKRITRAEHLQWVEFGKKLAEPHIEVFPSCTQAELKQFVMAYCDGQILCDHQVRDLDIGMVFMCIALGAFSLESPDKEKGTEGSPAWHAAQELPDGPEGPKPRSEPAPVPPEKAAYPEQPAEPQWLTPDPAEERRLEAAADAPDVEVQSVGDLFAEGDSLRVDEYHHSIALKNDALRAAHEKAIEEWKQAKAEIDRAHKARLEDHDKAVLAWRESQDRLRERVAQWERETEICEAADLGFGNTRLQNIGVIYEYISKAGPRSINGYPCFFSFRILNKADWLRAHAAIVRELKRREDMEI